MIDNYEYFHNLLSSLLTAVQPSFKTLICEEIMSKLILHNTNLQGKHGSQVNDPIQLKLNAHSFTFNITVLLVEIPQRLLVQR